MKFLVISFDLQGTLSPLSISEEFWSDVLPCLYAKNQNMPLVEAKKSLLQKSKKFDLYDYRYYSVKYWLKKLRIDISVRDALSYISLGSHVYKEYIPCLEELSAKVNLIVVSSACREFIDLELGLHKNIFSRTYSAVDDFGIGGKPPELYVKICEELNVTSGSILHIGDDHEMDIRNAKNAGLKTFYFNRDISQCDLVESLKNYLRK